MGTLVLAGATSGSATLTPVDAVTAVITLPSATATLATLGANTFVGNQAITGTLSATGLTTLGASAQGVQIDRVSDATGYGLITLNGVYASTTACGIYGRGSGGDSGKLFITGIGSVVSQIAGVTVTSVSSTGLAVGTDINIGYTKSLSVLATGSVAAIVSKTDAYNYPNHTMWNAANANDNSWVVFLEGSGGTARGSIDFNRGGTLTRYNTTSDATLKNLIGDAPQARSLEILSQTRLREYSWKSDETNKPQIGVIAQELVDVFPGAVSVGGDLAGVDEEGNPTTKYHPWSVDKTAYQFHLVAGWQSHEAKIAALEARLAELEAK